MLKNMKINYKMILILLIPTLGMVIFAGSSLSSNHQVSKEMRATQQMVTLAVDVENLVHELQKERGLSAGFISSRAGKFKPDLLAQREKTEDGRKELFRFLDSNQRALTTVADPLRSALAQLETLGQTRSAVDGLAIAPPVSFRYFTDLIGTLQDVVAEIVSVSNNTDIMSSAFAYLAFTNQKEFAGQERATVNAALAAGHFDREGYERYVRILSAQDTHYRNFARFVDKQLLKEYGDKYANSPQYRRIDEVRAGLLGIGTGGDLAIAPEVWFRDSTQKINLMKEFEDQLAAHVTDISTRTADAARRSFVLSLVLTVIFAVLTFGLALVMLLSITRSLTALVGMMQEIARGEGDMNRRMTVDRKDEFGQLSYWFNQFVDKIQANVAKLVASLR